MNYKGQEEANQASTDYDWQEAARKLDNLEDDVDARSHQQYVAAVKGLAAASDTKGPPPTLAEEAATQIPLYRSPWGKTRIWMHRNIADFAQKWALLLANPIVMVLCWLLTPKSAWLLHMASGATISPWWYLTLMLFAVCGICGAYFACYVLLGPYNEIIAPARRERLAEEDAVIIAALQVWQARFERCAFQKNNPELDAEGQRVLTSMQVDLLQGIRFHMSLLADEQRPANIQGMLNEQQPLLLRRRPRPPGSNPLFTAR